MRLRLLSAVTVLFLSAIAWAKAPARVVVNGQALALAPVNQSGSLLVPMRAIFEALDASVDYDAGTRTITATRGGTTVVLVLGSREARINGQASLLSVAARLVDGRTYVPLRFVSEALGARVGWDPATETATIALASGVPDGAVAARVGRVIDGDTIELADGTRVRLIGVDTPETVDPSQGVQPYGPEASAYTKAALEGQVVWLTYDVERTDRYGRTLAYVWLADGSLFNETLLRQGYGVLLTIPPNVAFVERFTAAQAEAREAGRGLWAGRAPDPSASAVRIASVDLAAEVVVIENTGDEAVDLSGWVLVSEKGNQRFAFPDGFALDAGARVRVLSGPAAENPGAGDLVWTGAHMWNNDGDPAVLLDGLGNEVSRL